LKILKIAGGNKTKAAEMLGLAITTLYRKIAYYKI
jgi:DNA-binding protein Fis